MRDCKIIDSCDEDLKKDEYMVKFIYKVEFNESNRNDLKIDVILSNYMGK